MAVDLIDVPPVRQRHKVGSENARQASRQKSIESHAPKDVEGELPYTRQKVLAARSGGAQEHATGQRNDNLKGLVVGANLLNLTRGGAPVLFADKLDLVPDFSNKTGKIAGQMAVHDLGPVVIPEDLGVWEAVVGDNNVVGGVPQTGAIVRAINEKLGPVVGNDNVRPTTVKVRQGIALALLQELGQKCQPELSSGKWWRAKTHLLRTLGQPLTDTIQSVELTHTPVGKGLLGLCINPSEKPIRKCLTKKNYAKGSCWTYQGKDTPSGTVELTEKKAKIT